MSPGYTHYLHHCLGPDAPFAILRRQYCNWVQSKNHGCLIHILAYSYSLSTYKLYDTLLPSTRHEYCHSAPCRHKPVVAKSFFVWLPWILDIIPRARDHKQVNISYEGINRRICGRSNFFFDKFYIQMGPPLKSTRLDKTTGQSEATTKKARRRQLKYALNKITGSFGKH